MFLWTRKDTRVMVPVERNKLTIVYYTFMPFNDIWSRNMDYNINYNHNT
jgi:hypothetical protein